ncbi:MAG: baseplate J/gp47 family protein, partial [Ardenticatenaceae bacterium]|nr:baseplate J/gp47 family protein [Ardenticatenaceae bacterium]
DWQEQSAADLGHALVDVLAYVGDYLSYYQDAVATEAYLGTARRRGSVRRHTRLLDYWLHEGCNARALVQIAVSRTVALPARTPLVTQVEGATAVIHPDTPAYAQADRQNAHFFETMHTAVLHPAHNQIPFFVPDGAEPILPAGATRAWLRDDGRSLALRPGDLLIFREIRNPDSGDIFSADTTHRHAIRLTHVWPYHKDGQHIVEIGWHVADAPPFPLVLRRYTADQAAADVTVACGNIVLADYGRSAYKLLPPVPPRERYRPRLTGRILTYAEPLPPESQPLNQFLLQNPRLAMPQVTLWQRGRRLPALPADLPLTRHALHEAGTLLLSADGQQAFLELDGRLHQAIPWQTRRELLNSSPFARDYLVEIADTRNARLRFGFGGLGAQPAPGAQFVARYRAGCGPVGNVGIQAIAHVVLPPGDGRAARITAVTNFLPAVGGQSREDLETARLLAPASLQTQARCVIPADFAEVARRFPDVAEARAAWRWTGAGRTAVVHVRRRDGRPVDTAFRRELQEFMAIHRLIGTEVVVREPETAPVYLRLQFTPRPHAAPNAVRGALRAAFTAFFAPARFRLGQNLHRSQVIAHAMTVPGVQTVTLVHFSAQPESAGPYMADELLVPDTAVLHCPPANLIIEESA